jgi:hypothetical protein
MSSLRARPPSVDVLADAIDSLPDEVTENGVQQVIALLEGRESDLAWLGKSYLSHVGNAVGYKWQLGLHKSGDFSFSTVNEANTHALLQMLYSMGMPKPDPTTVSVVIAPTSDGKGQEKEKEKVQQEDQKAKEKERSSDADTGERLSKLEAMLNTFLSSQAQSRVQVSSSGPLSRRQIEADFTNDDDADTFDDPESSARPAHALPVREFLRDHASPPSPGHSLPSHRHPEYASAVAANAARASEKVDVSLRRMAPYAFATAGGSMSSYVKNQVKWKSHRNEHEALVLARMVDEGLNEHLDPNYSSVLEIGCRRIASLQHADENPKEGWHLAEVSGYGASSTSLFPVDMLDQLLKRSTVVKKLHSSTEAGSGRRSRSANDKEPTTSSHPPRKKWPQKNDEGDDKKGAAKGGSLAARS